MLFSSYEFIFCFLPLVWFAYFFIFQNFPKCIQHGFLVISSLVFYAWFNVYYLPIIIFSIGFNYLVSLIIAKFDCSNLKRGIFFVGIAGNVFLLGYFKYYDFFIENLNYLVGSSFLMKHLILPLGISFFTFQQISFLVDSYVHPSSEKNLIDYSLFVIFFPQLIAGPIVTYSEMMPQFFDEKNRYLNKKNVVTGIYIFAIGMFKKLVVADTMAIVADAGFDKFESLSFFQAWFTSLAYTLQIYFDFSGYCDMAIGCAGLFNISLPMNFNSPYKSLSLKEFWRRWHITLGRALTTFIYIPLGGNRRGTFRLYFCLMFTFLVSGLWHGAAWTFIFWGAAHGSFLVLERMFDDSWQRISDFLRGAIVFLFVNFTWIFFRAKSWENAWTVLKGHFSFDFSFNLETFLPLTYNSRADFVIVIIIFVVSLISIFFCRNSIEQLMKFEPTITTAISCGLMLIISIIFMSRVSPFIYFNF
ncbi:MAG: membrane-bound O-acyltransferase family protein [Flavobacterium sp.]|nr:membrane-bound O-acyltransferase family protein [Flavobacterium sp.]